MGDKSKIEWTDATWNPIRGCSVVSEGCRNCYAMQVAARFSGDDPKTGKPLAYKDLAYRNDSGAHWTGKVKLIEEHLQDPLRWKEPRRIFVNSMSDLFHESIPDEWIDRIFAVMGNCDEERGHVFQILTKRPERMRNYMQTRARKAWNGPRMNRSSFPPGNIWLGVSVEDQRTADERIPLLMETPADVRWISAEPLLGLIDLEAVPTLEGSIDWVVAGGESGHGARPMNPDWARSLRDQCVAAHVPFFFKQWGEFACYAHGLGPAPRVRRDVTLSTQAGSMVAIRVGKKSAGRLLDGREWNEYPTN